jgi:hypothetical protein
MMITENTTTSTTKPGTKPGTKPDALLRLALVFDGVVTPVTGVALAAFAWTLADPLGIASGLLLGTGLFFVAYGLGVLYLGTRPTINRRGAAAVVVINLVSALDSVLVAVFGDLTTLGTVMVCALAAAVAGLGGLQTMGLRRSR